MKRPADCHPEKPNYGRGLCSTCYMRQWNAWQKQHEDGYHHRAQGPRALREALADARYQIAMTKHWAERPAVTKRRDQVSVCPHCHSRTLWDDGPFVACLCGTRIPVTDGDWERELGRLAISRPA